MAACEREFKFNFAKKKVFKKLLFWTLSFYRASALITSYHIFNVNFFFNDTLQYLTIDNSVLQRLKYSTIV